MAPRPRPPIERFVAFLLITETCWEWQGYRDKDGYGRFSIGRGQSPVAAHRFAYEYFVGPVPEGLELDHLCRNTCCVRYDHLEAVPPRINQQRGFGVSGLNHRKTQCLVGHPYDDENTYLTPDGHRDCRACRREANRRRRAIAS